MQNLSYILLVIVMYISAPIHKTGVAFKALAIVAISTSLLIYSKNCFNGALRGLEFCFTVLVPSLFPFMAVSSFIVKSGLANKLGKPFGFIMRKLFGLNGCFAPILLLSVIGGYPVGAKGISTLVKSGSASEDEAKKASLYAVCAGPGFIVSFVGVSLYGNEKIGFIILFSQIISVILLGIVLNFFIKNKSINSVQEIKSNQLPLSSTIVESASESSKGILSICAFVVLFSAFTEIIDALINNINIENGIFCLLEVCLAVNKLSVDCPIEAVAFAIGFGGLCVHFQIFSALGNININKPLFFFIRIIQGVITAILTHFGMYSLNEQQAVFSTSTVDQSAFFGGTTISGIALIGVAICFLYSLKSCKQN